MRSFVEELGQVLDPALIAHLTEGIVADEAAELRSVHTPLSGELLARVPQSTVSDVALAVQQARPALRVWKSLGHKRRAAVVLGFHDKLLARRDEVVVCRLIRRMRFMARHVDSGSECAIGPRHLVCPSGPRSCCFCSPPPRRVE